MSKYLRRTKGQGMAGFSQQMSTVCLYRRLIVSIESFSLLIWWRETFSADLQPIILPIDYQLFYIDSSLVLGGGSIAMKLYCRNICCEFILVSILFKLCTYI